ncbi:DUF721 domain-containing protein [Carboxylicivirga linearis]|uniref:DUF721 domain-containing protein n=1 Tax=Carboxylicivirga linearis TaxID=1628157 RepID=A0ABS5JRQ1_9BACT|nr:DUF721 domain-containing protein [Carboxylicivirga linearis]MBS2097517.1 DUF721 domain-containing protein [Carboxylicivirga linearis]
MKRKAVQPISDILKEYLKEKKLNQGLLENRAIQYWEKVLGPSVARSTRRIYMYQGTLYVELNSSVLRNELLMWKDRIIINLNQAIGDEVVMDLVLK